MTAKNRFPRTRGALTAVFLADNNERRLRKCFEDAGVLNLGYEVRGVLIPRFLDYGSIYSTQSTRDFVDVSGVEDAEDLAIERYCKDSIRIARGEGSAPQQALFATHDIIYCYYRRLRLHVVGFSCQLGNGEKQRRVLLSSDPLCDVLFSAPAELFALAATYDKAFAKIPITFYGDDDVLEFEEGEPAPLPASKPRIPAPSNLRPKKLVKKVPVKPVKKLVAKRPAMRLVKPFDPTL